MKILNYGEANEDLEGDLQKTMLRIVSHDFTKRQMKIIGFILIFCMHNHSTKCYIPTLSSFENCGVTKTKIRYEIEKLEKLNILSWDREKMIFEVNTYVDTWKIKSKDRLETDGKIQSIKDLNDVTST